MSVWKKRYSLSETRKDEEHLRLLEQLENLPLSDSCCEICHCDCYSSHRSSELSVEPCEEPKKQVTLKGNEVGRNDNNKREHAHNDVENDDDDDVDETLLGACALRQDNNNNNNNKSKDEHNKSSDEKPCKPVKTATVKTKTKRKHKSASKSAKTTPTRNKSPSSADECRGRARVKRSKSATSLRSQSPAVANTRTFNFSHYTRDCKILEELLNVLEDRPKLAITGTGTRSKAKSPSTQQQMNASERQTLPAPWPSLMINKKHASTAALDQISSSSISLAPLKLCESMASLCLAPTVRQAFHQVPTHDKKILNRMAVKRSEKAIAKENAWLARKYWENERYERELLKCEQMEEYKRAVRDKQFQDYLLTKARLNEIAQKDLAELQRLRESLQEKDERARRRINAARLERGIQLCQRRCDELTKSEAVNVHQEEMQLDERLRKQEICHRLTERLQRAEHIRSQMLESYLKRLRYDNYIEQLLHEEHWRETQEQELAKREQLKQHITEKACKSQHFVENRQRRNEAITKTAKISASLRELVRASVTPEGAAAGTTYGVTMPLGKLLLERPIPKLSI